ncbi:MAG: 1-(5-phosphoribosyl)-5-[(5-phosphoribosylamino)methylideneamino]imidazole-4-carboxamide isomerase [Candidatus Omnitrophica bacterium]|nr:1-(5-phosphoribosyl)-5-[(5-phosphoribosylamino)methylideneamino]imidazole-4-carboxamide isomerase [Candidatus Omnitrophota bacterium]MDD5437171.1 1-(5-phosphoribosyl)-5-[(5-phosphoribosylamino)methylideneamino]imidazole-4-carboxamide isomerase [Candidatus Omnitrophota bacterium]
MLVIPAVDIKGGKVVRLTQGLADKETVYSESPVEMAEKWAAFGVKCIHVVDLDGALQGEPKNLKVIGEIARAVKPAIEMGGGIRDIETIERVLDTGVQKVCIGTKALDRKFLAAVSKSGFRETVIVAIDAKDGLVRTKGWVEKTGVKAVDLIKEIADFGIRTVNYTDISKDGMLEGPNISSLKELLAAAKLDIVAAGGITTVDDVKRLKTLAKDGLKGMIIGKALYEGKIDLTEAVKICSQKE